MVAAVAAPTHVATFAIRLFPTATAVAAATVHGPLDAATASAAATAAHVRNARAAAATAAHLAAALDVLPLVACKVARLSPQD